MSRHVMMLRGVPVRVEPSAPRVEGKSPCGPCVFLADRRGCPLAEDEAAQGVVPCWQGAGHHYIKAESWRAPS